VGAATSSDMAAILPPDPDGPCRNRTYNLEIKSLLLCQLS
jgi:hypothetical protein